MVLAIFVLAVVFAAAQRPRSVGSILTGTGLGSGAAAVARSSSNECDVEFIVLQKDAYLEEPGRNLKTEVWPPHTTTVVRVHCLGKAPIFHESKNHGTGREDIHPTSQKLMLTEVKRRSVKSSWRRASKLLETIRTCSCDQVNGTKFLSINSLQPDAFARLTVIAARELRCPSPSTREIFLEVIAGRRSAASGLMAVQGDLGLCKWNNLDWQRGLTSALARALGQEHKQYHVCNNDAAIQASVFSQFANGRVPVCDASRQMCKSPNWFYAP